MEIERVEKPWGYFVNIFEGKDYKIKKLVVYPKQRLSLQIHNHRSEHWIIIKGKGKAIVGENEILIKENDHVFVPVKTKHRLENIGDDELIVIEVQVGDYLGEDDIIRLEDDYGRV